ncbi:hypothetical protein ABZV93_28365 [Actinopolymorpha sp. NPDC004070]|uniref:hypothetical protein n=1 Tax=Actinopolymorpha sp. NPDC004070 TaxID=3154548 RepID=UPI00339F4E11
MTIDVYRRAPTDDERERAVALLAGIWRLFATLGVGASAVEDRHTFAVIAIDLAEGFTRRERALSAIQEGPDSKGAGTLAQPCVRKKRRR